MNKLETIERNLARVEREHLELLHKKNKSRVQVNRMDTVRKRRRGLRERLVKWFSGELHG